MITTELPNHKGRIYGESRMDWEKGKMVGELHGVLLRQLPTTYRSGGL